MPTACVSFSRSRTCFKPLRRPSGDTVPNEIIFVHRTTKIILNATASRRTRRLHSTSTRAVRRASHPQKNCMQWDASLCTFLAVQHSNSHRSIILFASSSRLGVVYVPKGCVPPSSAFRTWLDSPSLGALLDGIGMSLITNLKARLSELSKKLMWPTLEYMAGRGDAVFREEVATLQVGTRIVLP